MSRRLSTLAMVGAACLTAFAAAAQAQQDQAQQDQAQPDQAQPSQAQPSQAQPDLNQPNLNQPNLTQTCAFRDGPRAGQTIDYAGAPGAVSVPVGNRCADMQGSSGEAVAEGTARQQGQGRLYMSPGAPNAWGPSGNLRSGFTQTCRFNGGPRAGTSLDYSHTLGAQPIAIGAACSDGPNTGIAVAPAPGM